MTTTFLSLPVELRLRIAEYGIFEQTLSLGFPWLRDVFKHDHDYKPSENLALLLVCRQFHDDFTQLAYSNTKFTVCCDGIDQALVRLHELPEYKTRNIRRLAFGPDTLIGVCERFLLEAPQLQLHQLDIICSEWYLQDHGIPDVVSFFRRLSNTKFIKLILYEVERDFSLKTFCALIGAIMKEDHYQRYDAPGAPNIETTWWDWCLSLDSDYITFEAQPPRPILLEEDYMLLMKPKVDGLMALAEKLAGCESCLPVPRN
ncbi:hypothetical protein B5807_07866 [Epicoccum nigrum]|uniref:F-box domain-containing protein n=1 Tax=Epicoccum nigrum TaxID=105696 RepID=A0A1Y2LYE4_EPING|nr:hypothetical protein B5807_07866 [Epicoccum nigrum]